jgi:hypothetical protein
LLDGRNMSGDIMAMLSGMGSFVHSAENAPASIGDPPKPHSDYSE